MENNEVNNLIGAFKKTSSAHDVQIFETVGSQELKIYITYHLSIEREAFERNNFSEFERAENELLERLSNSPMLEAMLGKMKNELEILKNTNDLLNREIQRLSKYETYYDMAYKLKHGERFSE